MIQPLQVAAVVGGIFFGAAAIDANSTITIGCAATVFAATIGSAWWSGRKWQSFLDHQKGLAKGVAEQAERLERVEVKIGEHDGRFDDLDRKMASDSKQLNEKIDRLSLARKFDLDELRLELIRETQPPSDKRLRLLLVDDDDRDRLLFRRTMGSFYAIDESPSLADAIQKTATKHYDCVVLDLYLPDSIPTETISRFVKEHPGSVCVAFSGTQSDEHINTSIKSGAHSFISKCHFNNATYISQMILLAINRKQIVDGS